MALATNPTLDSLTIEGLVIGGHPGIAAGNALQLRAETWVQEMFNDIDQSLSGKKLKPVMVTSFDVTVDGKSRYALPSDCAKIQTVTILDGSHTGNCTAVTASTATLAASESAETDFMQGKMLLLTSGTAVGNCSQITDWNNTTKVASVTPDFTATSFDGTEGYMVVDTLRNLDETEISLLDKETSVTSGIPRYYFPIGQGNGDADETGEMIFDIVPDDVYGIQLRYFANLNLTDLSSNLLVTLYRKWQNVIIQKVFYKTLLNDRNYTESRTQEEIYWELLNRMIAIEAYGHDLSNLTSRVIS